MILLDASTTSLTAVYIQKGLPVKLYYWTDAVRNYRIDMESHIRLYRLMQKTEPLTYVGQKRCQIFHGSVATGLRYGMQGRSVGGAGGAEHPGWLGQHLF